MIDFLITQFAAIEPIDWIAMLAGIVGVSLSIKERLSAWPCFILCYLAYIYISFRSGYLAFSLMNALFVIIAFYGWYHWSSAANQGKNKKHSLKISRVPRKFWPFVLLFVATCTVAIGWILLQMDSARLPFWDAFAVSSALVAQWLLSRKYLENWIFWIISDIVYVTLFVNDRLWPSVFLFGTFILLACKGWHDWRKSL